MKRIICLLLLWAFPAFAGSAAQVSVNVPINIATSAPAPKAGGGEYFSARVEVVNGVQDGVSVHADVPQSVVIFTKPGSYTLSVTVYRLTKGSCAGVKAEVYSERTEAFEAR